VHPAIKVARDHKRGCGWRKIGGIYLMSEDAPYGCARLPIPLEKCPCCGRGIVPARGFTWVRADELLRASPACPLAETRQCRSCPINQITFGGIGQAGLIWIGEKYYPTVDHFVRESMNLGVSRRLAHLPHDFKIGETYILLAHKRAIVGPFKAGERMTTKPGIFWIFRPSRAEIVVRGNEPDEKIERLLKRGLIPVVIERQGDLQEAMTI
jgi:hypothetical protein